MTVTLDAFAHPDPQGRLSVWTGEPMSAYDWTLLTDGQLDIDLSGALLEVDDARERMLARQAVVRRIRIAGKTRASKLGLRFTSSGKAPYESMTIAFTAR